MLKLKTQLHFVKYSLWVKKNSPLGGRPGGVGPPSVDLGRDVKVSRPCWSRDRKLWSRSRSRSRTIRSRSQSQSHEDVGLGLTHVGLVVSK